MVLWLAVPSFVDGASDIVWRVMSRFGFGVKGMKVVWRLEGETFLCTVSKWYLWHEPIVWSHICVIWSVFSRPSLQKTGLLRDRRGGSQPNGHRSWEISWDFSVWRSLNLRSEHKLNLYIAICTKIYTANYTHFFCVFFSSHQNNVLFFSACSPLIIVQSATCQGNCPTSESACICMYIYTHLLNYIVLYLFMIMCVWYIYIYKSIKTSSISQVPWGSRTSRSAVSTVATHFLGRSAMAAHAAAGRVGQRLGQADGGSGCVSWGSNLIYHEKWWCHRILWWKVVISWKLYDEKLRLNGIWSWRMVIEWRFHGIYHQQWGFLGKWDWIYPLVSSNVARKPPNKRRFLAGKIINEWWIFHCHVCQKVADV